MIYAIAGGTLVCYGAESAAFGCAAFLLFLALDEIHDELREMNRRQRKDAKS